MPKIQRVSKTLQNLQKILVQILVQFCVKICFFGGIFAFLEDDDRKPQVPPWAIKVVLDEDELDENRKE